MVSVCRAVPLQDNFNDGDDAGWLRFTPLAPFGGTTVAVVGGKYRLACEPSPDPVAYGPGRAAAFRQDASFSSFCVMVDISDFDPADDTSMALMARIQTGPVPGNVDGYSFSYQSGDLDVQISRVTDEVPVDLGRMALNLVAGKSYRLVFCGIGDYLEGRVFDLEDLGTPLIRISTYDNVYTQGTTGLVVFSETNSSVAASFDQFRASEAAPPPLGIRLDLRGVPEVYWDVVAALGADLERSADLVNWVPDARQPVIGGGVASLSAQVAGGPFFRLRAGPPP